MFLFAGFLVSSEVFRDVRIPFTGIRLGAERRKRVLQRDAEIAAAVPGDGTGPGT